MTRYGEPVLAFGMLTLYRGPLSAVFAVGGTLILVLGVMWWIFGPAKLFRPRSRYPHRKYRFRDDDNNPMDD